MLVRRVALWYFRFSKYTPMMSIAVALEILRREIPANVTLLAVSKTHPVEAVREAYAAGQRAFGENKVQELVTKAQSLPTDIEWHLIGHLQTNKVKTILPFVSLIHSVDSLKLLQVIESESAKLGRRTRVLLQVHIAQEDTKFGFTPEEVRAFFTTTDWKAYSHVEIAGLMGMASNTNDREQVRREFHSLKSLFDEVKGAGLLEYISILSMGMSGDYPIAIAEGSTLIRVGSRIFGARNYNKR